MTGGRKAIAKIMRDLAYGHSLWEAWRDWTEAAALALRNVADLIGRDAREARYLAILGRYKPEQQRLFPEAYGALVMEMDTAIDDVLGGVFMEFELGNQWAGQFFTPFSVCRAMAAMTLGDPDQGLKATIAERGFITAADPAVGGGAMPLAIVAEMVALGLNPQRQLHVTAQDIDERAVWMAYIQLSLCGIPAAIVVGDTLRMECRDCWYTPAHITGLWSYRLRPRQVEASPPSTAPSPTPVAAPDPPAAASPPQLALF